MNLQNHVQSATLDSRNNLVTWYIILQFFGSFWLLKVAGGGMALECWTVRQEFAVYSDNLHSEVALLAAQEMDVERNGGPT